MSPRHTRSGIILSPREEQEPEMFTPPDQTTPDIQEIGIRSRVAAVEEPLLDRDQPSGHSERRESFPWAFVTDEANNVELRDEANNVENAAIEIIEVSDDEEAGGESQTEPPIASVVGMPPYIGTRNQNLNVTVDLTDSPNRSILVVSSSPHYSSTNDSQPSCISCPVCFESVSSIKKKGKDRLKLYLVI